MGRNHKGENEDREAEPANGQERNQGVVVPVPEKGGATRGPERGTESQAEGVGCEASSNVSRVAVDRRGWGGVRLLPNLPASGGLRGLGDAAPSVQR